MSKWNRLSTKGKNVDGLGVKRDCQIYVLSRWNEDPLATGGVKREDRQYGGWAGCGDHLPPHKYIKKKIYMGKNSYRTLLNTGRRPQTAKTCVADRVLVLQPAVRPEPLRWESRVQDIGPPETSRRNVISIGESTPRDLCPNDKTQFHSKTSKLQCWTPYAKQLERQEHNTTH